MKSIEPLLPPPDVAAAAVVELATADQPRSADAGLDLLTSMGIYSGTLRSTEEQSTRVVIEPAGPWRTTDSGLMLGPDGGVKHFWSHFWFESAPDAVLLGFQSLIDAVNGSIGAPDDEDRRAHDSRSALWTRRPGHIEAYLFPEAPKTRAGVQIGVSWASTP